METEFLNFRDEERFTAYDSFDYQETSGILEWSSITGIKNEYSYTTQSSRDSMDDSGAYWGDEERELNGDIAVIPVSGRLDHVFPHLSTSPDCKEDFQKMLSDWHEHIGALEGSDTEDHMSIVTNHQDDLSMSHIDYGPTPKIHNSSPYRQLNLDTNVLSLPKKKKTESSNDDTTKFEPDSFHSPFSIEDSHLDQSLSEVELNLGHDALKIDIESIVKVEDEILMKTEPIDDNEVCSFDKDLKNFDLVTAVVKDEIDLNLSIENDKNQIYNSPEFDMSPKDNFDLTSYINGDEDKCILKDKKGNVSMAGMFNSNMVEDICSEIKQFEKKSTNVSDIKSKSKTNKNKTKSKKNVKKLTSERSPLKVDVEDDCIDVETVSPTGIHPVIEAGDLTTLLEQFEATEAVNTTSKQVKTPDVCSQMTKDLCKSDSKKLASDKMLCVSQKNMCKRYKKLARFDDNESVPKDVLERIRASGKKKPITVIPAMPAKKPMKSIRSQDNEVSNKILWSTAGYSSPGEKSIQLDHNYCTLSPTKSPLKVANSVTSSDTQNMESVTEYYKVLKKPDVIGRGIGSKGIRCADTPDPSSDPKNEIEVSAIETNTENRNLKTVIVSKKHINDTAIRIQNRNEIIIRKQISPNKIVKVSPTTPTKLKIMPQSRTIITQGTLLKNGSRVQQSLLTVNQKSVLMKNAATSHQQSLLRSNVASFKNVDGKVMVSVLKTNNKNMVQNGNKIIVNTVVDTTTSKDKCVRNIITDETRNCTKKRKLNLEEYKKRREIGRTAHSCNTSRTNSPIGFVPSGNSSPMVHHGSFSLPVTAVGSPISQPGTPVYETIEPIKKIEPKKLSPEEKLLKMAADILTTPAKSSTSPDVKYTIEPFTEPKPEAEQSTEILKLPTKEEPATETICIPPKPVNEDFEMLTIVSIGVNTTESYFSENKFDSTEPEKSKINANVPTISFKIKKNEVLTKNKFFDSRCNENCESMLSESKSANIISADKNLQDAKSGTNKTLLNCKQSGTVDKEKLTEIIAPILQSATTKINSNSLISNITATILKKIPENMHTAKTIGVTQKAMKQQDNNLKIKPEVSQIPPEHGEDKTVIILDKKRPKPVTCDIEIQTDFIIDEVLEDDKKKMEKTEVKVLNNDRKCRQYRSRRVSSSSSSSNVSNRSLRISRKNFRSSSVTRSRRRSHHTSSTRSSHRRSVSSLGSSRWSRSSQSRSRSRSRSYSRSYSRSSYSSMSSRSPSPSSTRRRRLDSRRSSSSRYSRTRRRSRSNYRNYRHSRSPFNRGPRGRNGRSWESVEREKLRQVEERRVIYVGRLEPGTTKADLRRLFQKFGPVIEVSVHFRDQGDNYGFVTFSYQDDAYEAIEQGTNDPDLVHYDISFGGRRAFCKTRYSDLDNSDAIEMNGYRPMQEDSSFDVLLKEAQAKLRKRKA